MSRDVRDRLRRLPRILIIAGFLGLSLGYAVFESVFPNVGFPAAGEASLPLLLAVLAGAGFLAGLVADDLRLAILHAFLSFPIALVVVSLLAVSPVLTGYVELTSDDLVFYVLRLGLPLYPVPPPAPPALARYVDPTSDALFFSALRLALPIYLVALPAYAVLGVAGLAAREHLGLRSTPFRAWLRRLQHK